MVGEEISPDLLRRDRAGGDIDMWQLRGAVRQQAELNGASRRQLAADALLCLQRLCKLIRAPLDLGLQVLVELYQRVEQLLAHDLVGQEQRTDDDRVGLQGDRGADERRHGCGYDDYRPDS